MADGDLDQGDTTRSAVRRGPEMWLVAYYLSRCGQPRADGGSPDPPPQLHVPTWAEAYAMFYTRLGGGRTTETFHLSLRNARDVFDGHHESGRVGWREGETGRPPQPLGREAQALMDQWRGRSAAELWEAVRRLIGPTAGTPPDSITPAEPARRAEVVGDRIVRNSALIERVKTIHGDKCQVCRQAIEVPKGLYSEGGHIKPLGEPHNGPDVIGNILCLCPNHHVMLDYGAFAINDDGTLIGGGLEGRRLTIHSDHPVLLEYVRYHRTEIWHGGAAR